MASLKMRLKLTLFLFAIVSTNLVEIAYGIGKAQENANAYDKGNTQGLGITEGIGYAQGIVNQTEPGVPGLICCPCKKLFPCCPCPPHL